MKTHRDGFARFSARSVRRGDGRVEDATTRRHREACATLPESLSADPPEMKLPADPPEMIFSAGPPIAKPPFGSRMRPIVAGGPADCGGRRTGLTMPRIAGTAPPTRRAAYAISIGLH